ncbi:sulfurtransferase complex subunit TusD [Psychrobacter sp. I-STPA6b]|uniref:sulfurtransferase complex subunit TusD n=1 Tax=Psychrobacter sp. I-STPA6b TaxID=2585718 RepID=UPI001D0C620A|nr:sulfurtransferase complex subunit TusD [Psychrobacter sp. I-STPA6b]
MAEPTAKDSILLLITKHPNHPLAIQAIDYARTYLQMQSQANRPLPKLDIFFYAESAQIANCLRWQPADQVNLTSQWQALHHTFAIELPVCVSTALARGVCDTDNASRHQLQGENLADGFQLVGLGDLADKMHHAQKVIQF